MVEDQALDRVHRIGQTKEVTTVRYIVKNTLEEVRSHKDPGLVLGLKTSDIRIEHSPSAIEKTKLSRASVCSCQRPQ